MLEAFKHKYQYLKFNISGYYLNYDDEGQDIKNVLFTTGSLSVNNSISADSLNYDHTKSTGTVSSGRLTITVKINSDNTLIYSWFWHIQVRGEGAPYSHTEINATVNNLEFIKDSER